MCGTCKGLFPCNAVFGAVLLSWEEWLGATGRIARLPLWPAARQRWKENTYKSQLLLLGNFEYGGGPIFKVVLEC